MSKKHKTVDLNGACKCGKIFIKTPQQQRKIYCDGCAVEAKLARSRECWQRRREQRAAGLAKPDKIRYSVPNKGEWKMEDDPRYFTDWVELVYGKDAPCFRRIKL